MSIPEGKQLVAEEEHALTFQVRSSELLMPHPQIAPTRHYSYRPDHRYHPYGGGSRHHHYMAPATHYSTQPQPNYPQWSPFEYAGLPGTATPVAWNGSGYVSTYSGYENPATHTYNTLPPSYMIPELYTHERNAICMTSLGRPQQQQPNNQLWLDNIQTASLPQQMSCIYPLTPAESTKSYCGIPGQHALSNERSLPLPGQSGIVSLPSSGQDTPPLSAASQRSSNPWDSSIGSTVSSRTSCGGSTDLSGNMENASIPVTCEEQAIIYPYVSESASPQIHTAAAVLPMSSEQIEDHPTPENSHVMMPDTTQMVIRDRPSREHRAMSGSSYNALYGYSRHGRRSSSRRARTMLSNLYTNCASPHGSLNYSPTSNSRHDISTQQSQSAGETDIYQLSEHRGSNVSFNSLANY